MRSFFDIEESAASSRNQYLLANAAAKRVRHIKSGAPAVVESPQADRPIETALEEIARGLIRYRLPEQQDS